MAIAGTECFSLERPTFQRKASSRFTASSSRTRFSAKTSPRSVIRFLPSKVSLKGALPKPIKESSPASSGIKITSSSQLSPAHCHPVRSSKRTAYSHHRAELEKSPRTVRTSGPTLSSSMTPRPTCRRSHRLRSRLASVTSCSPSS